MSSLLVVDGAEGVKQVTHTENCGSFETSLMPLITDLCGILSCVWVFDTATKLGRWRWFLHLMSKANQKPVLFQDPARKQT